MATIKDRVKRYFDALGHVNKKWNDQLAVAREKLKKESANSSVLKVFTNDINETFANFGVMGQEVIELIIQLTGKDEWRHEWKHITIPNYTFWQYKSKNGQTLNTGIFDKQLLQIIKGKKKENCTEMMQVKHILTMRTSSNGTKSQPANRMKFYSYKEDLPNHISEAFVLIDNGFGVIFFQNAYVCNLFMVLDDCHQPVYHQKLMRLL